MRPAVLIVDREGFILQATGGFGGFGDLDVADFVGKHALEIVAKEDQESLATIFMQAVGRSDFTVARPIPFVVRSPTPDGGFVAADAVATGVAHGDEQGWVVVLHPHDQQTIPVAALSSLLEGASLATTLALAADHIAGPGNDGRRLASVIATDQLSSTGSLDLLGTKMPPDVADALRALLIEPNNLLADIGARSVQFRAPALPEALAAAMQRHGFEDLIVMAIPLEGRGRATLVAVGGPARDPVPDNVTQLMERVAQVAALAMRSDREHRDLLHALMHDPLTGLGNRRRLDEVLEQLGGDDHAIVYADLDLFKAVNDTYGHIVGDEVLTEVAERIRSCCRPSDVACRLGGDEFVVVLVDASEGGAEQIAERLRVAIAAPLPDALGPRSITASIGVARATSCGGSLASEVLSRADDAMRLAKFGRRSTDSRR